MASSSLVMIFVQHITDGRPSNSGAEQDYESESAFMNKKSVHCTLTENCILSLWLLSGLNQYAILDSPSSYVLPRAPYFPPPCNKFLI